MKLFHIVLLLALVIPSSAQENYFTSTVKSLSEAKSNEEVNPVWDNLVAQHKIPLVENDSVAFLFRGEAMSVSWIGDFNAWGYNKTINTRGTKVPGTDLWILKMSFPKDARLDYKILVNESEWILDPNNEHHQWTGLGGGSPNSELRMPEWKEDPLTTSHVDGAKRGVMQRDLLFNSKALGYQLTYSIYLPVGYSAARKYPIIYVTDGYEYMHERMGNMPVILDNLIHLKKIQPVIAVFVDNREPINRGNNKRMQELAMNEKYLQFLTGEMVPSIEKMYSVNATAGSRGVIGTSMGGLSAAYFAFSRPDVFGLAGIQSPAFWFKPEIFTFCDNPSNPPLKTFMTTGLINDREEGAYKMKALLEKNTCTYQFREVNQGHSWGNWRDLIDDILIYFFPVN
jgi:enterochelin esterase-like enzyme